VRQHQHTLPPTIKITPPKPEMPVLPTTYQSNPLPQTRELRRSIPSSRVSSLDEIQSISPDLNTRPQKIESFIRSSESEPVSHGRPREHALVSLPRASPSTTCVLLANLIHQLVRLYFHPPRAVETLPVLHAFVFFAGLVDFMINIINFSSLIAPGAPPTSTQGAQALSHMPRRPFTASLGTSSSTSSW
jgi:hypothetical protein